MSNRFKKTILVSLLAFIFITPAVALAQNYTPLQPIPELGITGNDPDLGDYLNRLFRGGILAAGILAVIMVTVGGIQYMTTDAVFGKTQGRERIVAALGGLILALASWIILNTINSQLITGSLDIESTKVIDSGNLGDGSDLLGNFEGNGAELGSLDSRYTATNVDTPAAMTSDGFTQGRATNFGYQDSEDNGYGSPLLKPGGLDTLGIPTNNLQVRGVALPQSVLQRELGIGSMRYSDWGVARNSAVRVTNGNQTFIVPIVDLGPGAGPQARGVVIDETKALNNAFGGDGPRAYEILPNYYTTNPR